MSDSPSNSDDTPVDTDDSARPRDADAPDQRTVDSDEPTEERVASEPAEERDPDYDGPNRFEQGKWLSAIIAILGLWMIAQAFLFDLVDMHQWNDILVGVLLVAVGGYNYSRRADEQFGSVPAAIVAAAAGLWLILTPFIIGGDTGMTGDVNDVALWSDFIVGLVALALGGYSAYRARTPQRETRAAEV